MLSHRPASLPVVREAFVLTCVLLNQTRQTHVFGPVLEGRPLTKLAAFTTGVGEEVEEEEHSTMGLGGDHCQKLDSLDGELCCVLLPSYWPGSRRPYMVSLDRARRLGPR